MRLRLKVPHTPEDMAVWSVLRDRWPPGHSAYCEFMFGDRRDAKLMWSAQQARHRTFPVDMPPLSLIAADGEIACGGAMWDADPVWRHRHST